MSHSRRASSTVRFPEIRRSSIDTPLSPTYEIDTPLKEWLASSPAVAKDLIDSPAVVVDGDATVEKACEALLSGPSLCLVVQSKVPSPVGGGLSIRYDGLFDYADVNSFLLLGLKARTLAAGEVPDPRTSEILQASKDGVVPVRLACNISQKNPLEIREGSESLISLLKVYATGKHRVVIRDPNQELTGIASDLHLIRWLLAGAEHPSLARILARPLFSYGLGDSPVVSAKMDDTILDAMSLMDEHGVNSVAVLDEHGTLHSAVSVTDIGNLVIPSQSKNILSTTLGQFVSHIKEPAGATDGADHYPAYTVVPTSSLEYAMKKLVATNAHRLFIVRDPLAGSSPSVKGNLRGVVSVVDVLSIFARLVGVPDVDPSHLRRSRRTSSSSSRSSTHSRQSSSYSAPQSPASSLGLELGPKK